MPSSANLTTLFTGSLALEDESKVLQDYVIGQRLGEGAYGSVYVAKYTPSGESFALKILQKEDLFMNAGLGMGPASPLPVGAGGWPQGDAFTSPMGSAPTQAQGHAFCDTPVAVSDSSSASSPSSPGTQPTTNTASFANPFEKLIVQEATVMQSMDHPHVIKLYKFLNSTVAFYFIMELAEGGELFDLIISRHYFSEAGARHYFQQLVSAIDYCHRNGVAHKDLKAENLLLSRDSRLLVCDFGFSSKVTRRSTDDPEASGAEAVEDDNDAAVAGEDVVFGTLHYMSPEAVAASARRNSLVFEEAPVLPQDGRDDDDDAYEEYEEYEETEDGEATEDEGETAASSPHSLSAYSTLPQQQRPVLHSVQSEQLPGRTHTLSGARSSASPVDTPISPCSPTFDGYRATPVLATSPPLVQAPARPHALPVSWAADAVAAPTSGSMPARPSAGSPTSGVATTGTVGGSRATTPTTRVPSSAMMENPGHAPAASAAPAGEEGGLATAGSPVNRQCSSVVMGSSVDPSSFASSPPAAEPPPLHAAAPTNSKHHAHRHKHLNGSASASTLDVLDSTSSRAGAAPSSAAYSSLRSRVGGQLSALVRSILGDRPGSTHGTDISSPLQPNAPGSAFDPRSPTSPRVLRPSHSQGSLSEVSFSAIERGYGLSDGKAPPSSLRGGGGHHGHAESSTSKHARTHAKDGERKEKHTTRDREKGKLKGRADTVPVESFGLTEEGRLWGSESELPDFNGRGSAHREPAARRTRRKKKLRKKKSPAIVAVEPFQQDLWSAGVILFFMLTGRLPFDGRDDEETQHLIETNTFSWAEEESARISSQARGLVNAMLSADPTDRPTLDDIIECQWFVTKLDIHAEFPHREEELTRRLVQLGLVQPVPVSLLRSPSAYASPLGSPGSRCGTEQLQQLALLVRHKSEVVMSGGTSIASSPLYGSGVGAYAGGGIEDGHVASCSFLDFSRTHEVTEEEEEALNLAFQRIDTDGYGKITRDELRDMLTTLHGDVVRPEAVLELMTLFTGDGGAREISFQQFREAWVSKDLAHSSFAHIAEFQLSNIIGAKMDEVERQLVRQLREAFDSVDAHHTGVMEADDLREVFARCNIAVTADEIDSLMRFFYEKNAVFVKAACGSPTSHDGALSNSSAASHCSPTLPSATPPPPSMTRSASSVITMLSAGHACVTFDEFVVGITKREFLLRHPLGRRLAAATNLTALFHARNVTECVHHGFLVAGLQNVVLEKLASVPERLLLLYSDEVVSGTENIYSFRYLGSTALVNGTTMEVASPMLAASSIGATTTAPFTGSLSAAFAGSVQTPLLLPTRQPCVGRSSGEYSSSSHSSYGARLAAEGSAPSAGETIASDGAVMSACGSLSPSALRAHALHRRRSSRSAVGHAGSLPTSNAGALLHNPAPSIGDFMPPTPHSLPPSQRLGSGSYVHAAPLAVTHSCDSAADTPAATRSVLLVPQRRGSSHEGWTPSQTASSLPLQFLPPQAGAHGSSASASTRRLSNDGRKGYAGVSASSSFMSHSHTVIAGDPRELSRSHPPGTHSASVTHGSADGESNYSSCRCSSSVADTETANWTPSSSALTPVSARGGTDTAAAAANADPHWTRHAHASAPTRSSGAAGSELGDSSAELPEMPGGVAAAAAVTPRPRRSRTVSQRSDEQTAMGPSAAQAESVTTPKSVTWRPPPLAPVTHGGGANGPLPPSAGVSRRRCASAPCVALALPPSVGAGDKRQSSAAEAPAELSGAQSAAAFTAVPSSPSATASATMAASLAHRMLSYGGKGAVAQVSGLCDVDVILAPACLGYTLVKFRRIHGKTSDFHEAVMYVSSLLDFERQQAIEDTATRGESELM